jgi:nicotinamide-nucleotide amidase
MPPDDRQLLVLAASAGKALCDVGWRVALAESCTGGWLGKALTDVAGSSEFFSVGFTTYSNQSKQQTLGIAAETLASRGAVSREVVLQMAAGAQRLGGTQLAVAVSGVAGPAGGTLEKPVGLVWFGIAGPQNELRAEKQLFAGDRDAVRRQAVAHGLALIITAARVARQP